MHVRFVLPVQRANSVEQLPTHQMHAAEHLDDDIAMMESTDNPLAASSNSGDRSLDYAS
eukprot:COSAG02_NODE_66835_length_254_cov_0.987097_1_plen_58_part_10